MTPYLKQLFKITSTILIAGLDNVPLAAGRLVLPLIAFSLGADAWEVGLLTALFTLMPMLLSVRYGRWIDRSGTLHPIIMAGSLSVIGVFVYLLIPSRYTLLITAGCLGAGSVFSHMTAVRAIGEAVDQSRRTQYFGCLVFSYSISLLIGPPLAGASFDHFGAIAALVVIAGFPMMSLLLTALHFHHYERRPHCPNTESLRRGALKLLSVKPLRKWIIVNGVFATAQILFPFVVSLHAVTNGFTGTQAGLLVGAFAIGIMVSRASVAVITQWLPEQSTVSVSLLIAASIFVAFPFVHDFSLLIALSVLLGLPVGLGVPISLSKTYSFAPEGRINETVGLGMSVVTFLQTITPLMLGVFASGGIAVSITCGLILAMVAILNLSEIFSSY